ncbi:MAG: ABC transporter ATP-binding protein [Actinomycetota bacterium]
MNQQLLLRTEGISIRFGGISALDNVDVAVRSGEIVGLLGPNGAGKTTLFNVLGGLLKADNGNVLLDEHDITDLLPYERAAAGMGRTFQQVRLFRGLTVFENLLVAQHRHQSGGALSAMLRLPARKRDERIASERAEAVLDLVDLRHWRDALPEQLSYGTLRFLELAAALSLSPRVMLLDEPASGIAQREVEALGPMLERIRDEWGCSILLIEHDMSLLLSVAEWIYALDLGRVIAEGPPDRVVEDDRVLESYLGRTRRGAGATA